MNLNDTIVRGVLDISCAAPKIRARVHGVLKPLTIESSNVIFSNNITVMNSTNTNKIILSGSYGTGNPPADGTEGQLYFKII